MAARPDRRRARARGRRRASSGRRPAPSQMVVSPHASARRSAPRDGRVAARRRRGGRRRRGPSARSARGGVVVDECDRGQRSRADDDRVHELDGDVLGVLRAPGAQHHSVPPGGEPSRQGERRGREARRGSAELVAVMTIRHVAPLWPRWGASDGTARCRRLDGLRVRCRSPWRRARWTPGRVDPSDPSVPGVHPTRPPCRRFSTMSSPRRVMLFAHVVGRLRPPWSRRVRSWGSSGGSASFSCRSTLRRSVSFDSCSPAVSDIRNLRSSLRCLPGQPTRQSVQDATHRVLSRQRYPAGRI